MEPGTIALIVVAASIAAWALFMANVTIRRQRKAAAAHTASTETTAPGRAGGTRDRAVSSENEAKPAASGAGTGGDVTVEKVPEPQRKPLTQEQLSISRRQFLNRAWGLSFVGFLGFFGMSSLSFLWPTLSGGFGTKINAGDYEEILAQVGPDGGFLPIFNSEGRFWLTYYEGTGDAPVYAAIGAVDTKLQALYRKCVHLGCSVPHCGKSMLFECPCHGSKYRLHGEFFGGPAPRGLDRFPVQIEGGKVIVDTGALQVGPPRGVSTWERFAEPQGDFCVPV